VATLQPGVVGKLTACQRDWCHVKVDDYDGWLLKADFWGATAGEVFEK
jgi:SH3-like domain-containing protein